MLGESVVINGSSCSECCKDVAGLLLYALTLAAKLEQSVICRRCLCGCRETLYCKSVANVLAMEYSSQGLIVLVILFINTVLSITSRMLTLFEKHHTRSTEAKSLAHKLFLAQVGMSTYSAAYLVVCMQVNSSCSTPAGCCLDIYMTFWHSTRQCLIELMSSSCFPVPSVLDLQFLNSAVSTILANAHLPFLSAAIEDTAVDGIFFQGVFTDLTPNWYKLVGRSLVLSQIVGALLRIFNLVIK